MVTKKVTKKAPAKKKVVAKKQPAKMRSFHVAKNDRPFFSFKITRQTVYWTILVAFIIVMQLWILKVQFDVIQATDNVSTQTTAK